MKKTNTKSKEYSVRGRDLVEKVKELIHEGNVRKISVLDKKGKVIAVFPLTVGVVGAVVAPPLAAIGAIAALVSDCTIRVEKKK